MEETYGQRLRRLLGGRSVKSLAAHMGVSEQAIYQVLRGETKALTAANNSAAAKFLGVHPDLLANGTADSGAHRVSQPEPMITPLLLERGELVEPLPKTFLLDVWDDAMADELRQGSRLLFSTTETPRPRDFVLIADRDGNHYIREYRERTPTHWQAVALNAGYAPLDSTGDGLRVLAVMTGRMGRRG